jgi:hypothetical protein
MASFARARETLSRAMSGSASSYVRYAAIVASALAFAAFAGFAFAGWVEHAPGIFMALVESGLAWCF